MTTLKKANKIVFSTYILGCFALAGFLISGSHGLATVLTCCLVGVLGVYLSLVVLVTEFKNANRDS